MSSNRKGDRRERELVNRLDEAGFAVMRAPASGSATDRELPDVLAGDGGTFYAIEAKSTTDGGNYRVKKETALAEGEDFESFVGGPEQARLTEVGEADDAEGAAEDVGDG